MSFLAAHAHRGDMGTEALAEVWAGLNLAAHLRVDFFGFMGMRGLLRGRVGERDGRALLDPSGLERVVVDHIPWTALHDNIRQGLVHSLTVAALSARRTDDTFYRIGTRCTVSTVERPTPHRSRRFYRCCNGSCVGRHPADLSA